MHDDFWSKLKWILNKLIVLFTPLFWPLKSQFLLKYLRILYESLIFDYSHRCVGCLHVERYHRVSKFLRKRLLSACEVWTTILALKNVAPKSTNQIKDYTKRSDFWLFLRSIFHSITKWQKGVDITQTYVLYIDLNREHMFYSVLGMCGWPSIQNCV